MSCKAILLILSFALLLIYIEMIIYKMVVKPMYDRQNEYQKAECELTNKTYTKQITDPVLYDPHKYDTNMREKCNTCSPELEYDPEKDCDYMKKNNIEGLCCIHLQWYENDCCSWMNFPTQDCDKNGQCTQNDNYCCTEWTTTRTAFIKNEIYDVKYNIEIKNILQKCKKTEHCKDPLTSKKCLENIMNKDYEKNCYYKKKDEDVCVHLSKNGHFANLFLVFFAYLIMFIILLCYLVIALQIYVTVGNSNEIRNSYIEIV
jgi:hypothetical protein